MNIAPELKGEETQFENNVFSIFYHLVKVTKNEHLLPFLKLGYFGCPKHAQYCKRPYQNLKTPLLSALNVSDGPGYGMDS